jgi:hypothetical protein
MSDEKVENPVSYSQLQDLEDDFEDVELELRKFFFFFFFFKFLGLSQSELTLYLGRIVQENTPTDITTPTSPPSG